ncbi:MAG: helix-turn-helix domain-containing protein, partial [Gammaproteobacteria bacterium]|nr:helix-turn-helix domain-containing protein [Gammaproteobacteria bacterium]
MIVKRLRDKKNWSQEQLAIMTGLSTRTIQRIESGNKA